MAGILLTCGYLGCTSGEFTCDANEFPDISHVMGKAPLNKLYAIMLTGYACNKQAYVRAYHQRLTGVASNSANQLMVVYGILSCITGPLIGFFDVYYDMTVHCIIVGLFVAGEVLYVFTITSVLKNRRTQFPDSAQSGIDTMITARAITFVLGLVTLGSKILGIKIDPYSAYIEWFLFNMCFYLFAVLARIMPYDLVVVPETTQIKQ